MLFEAPLADVEDVAGPGVADSADVAENAPASFPGGELMVREDIR